VFRFAVIAECASVPTADALEAIVNFHNLEHFFGGQVLYLFLSFQNEQVVLQSSNDIGGGVRRCSQQY